MPRRICASRSDALRFCTRATGLRSSPIAGVVLTGADVDCIAGLLSMRERHPFTIYATGAVHDVLSANPVFEVLDRELVIRQSVPLDTTIALDNFLSFSLFAVPGKSATVPRRRYRTSAD